MRRLLATLAQAAILAGLAAALAGAALPDNHGGRAVGVAAAGHHTPHRLSRTATPEESRAHLADQLAAHLAELRAQIQKGHTAP